MVALAVAQALLILLQSYHVVRMRRARLRLEAAAAALEAACRD